MRLISSRLVLCLALTAAPVWSQEMTPMQGVISALGKTIDFLQPAAGAETRSFQLKGRVGSTTGKLAEKLKDATFSLNVEPPRRLQMTVTASGMNSTLCWNDQEVWIHFPDKKMLIVGDATVPRFSTRPDSVMPVPIDLFKLPFDRSRRALIPAFLEVTADQSTEGTRMITLRPSAAAGALPLPVQKPSLSFSFSGDGAFPESVQYADASNSFTLHLEPPVIGAALPSEHWKPCPAEGGTVERVALAHLQRFLKSSVAALGKRIPPLPPATGQRWLLGTSGAGRLEDHDGTRVLFLSGTPEEMGRQHGQLLAKEVRNVVDRILYGVGVGSSFGKGRWFFGEIEEAVRRTAPFIDPSHLVEMDALAIGAGLEPEEVRLANFFPELFHCSGFALLGKATEGGRIYHGRILDYLRGAGLEENAVVIVNRPTGANAWVNISYAGFTGSVTAMNEKQLSIGEMGGRGEGNWDGKPMAQLVREVMEKCSTVEEAIDFMRRTPRTCEYYYVVADAKSRRAAGIKATPDIFEVVWTGESHPELIDPVEDTVLLSAGDRYKELVRRVKSGFGTFEVSSAIDLMTPPVCMTSNIHSVLFAPDTLDFWVANADSEKVASETRYTRYNLRELLQDAPAPPRP